MPLLAFSLLVTIHPLAFPLIEPPHPAATVATVEAVPPGEKAKRHSWDVQLAAGMLMNPDVYEVETLPDGVEPKTPGVALGPSFAIAAHATRATGPRKNRFVGGGPVLQWGMSFDREYPADRRTVHYASAGGEFIGGGGNDAVVGYAAVKLMMGVIMPRNGDTGATGIAFDGRFAAGVGVMGFVTPTVSLGVRADAGVASMGFYSMTLLDAFLTVGFHPGRKAARHPRRAR
jgi:hypothetical protein